MLCKELKSRPWGKRSFDMFSGGDMESFFAEIICYSVVHNCQLNNSVGSPFHRSRDSNLPSVHPVSKCSVCVNILRADAKLD